MMVARVRAALRRAFPHLALRLRRRVPGRFQAYSYTEPDRYPWLFASARQLLAQATTPRLLSFGCSRGDEVLALRRYFPEADIKGIDVDPANIEACRARASGNDIGRVTFAVAASTEAEPSERYDAIFCLAVLCLGDLTALGLERCDPYLHFSDFDRVVTDFARCLKPDGLLFLHTTSFRFGDTDVSRRFDVVLEARLEQLATDVKFDCENRLLAGTVYTPVGFRKRR